MFYGGERFLTMEMRKSVTEQIERAPQSPGVYLFRGKGEKVLYVGKAIRLRDRLRSYRKPNRDERPSVLLLVPQIESVEWLLTDNEKEALLLENSLIKTHRPRYNINLRDDKSYVSLRMTKHPFPRLFITRKIIKDGSQYFGPYASVADLRKTLKLLQQIFQIRDCTDSFFSNRSRPCLRHQIKRCSAPCVGDATSEGYEKQVRQASLFLKGEKGELVERLAREMEEASSALRYEEAAMIRDRIEAVEETLEPQSVESRSHDRDADAIALAGDQEATLIKVLKMRNGRLLAADELLTSEPIGSAPEITRAFLAHYYLAEFPPPEIPSQLLLAHPISDAEGFEALLTERRGRRVRILYPKRGEGLRVLKLAERNSQSSLGERKRKSEKNQRLLEALEKKLQLPSLPRRIEGYDISAFHGADPIGAKVVFVDGEKDKTQYRSYRIRNVKGSNDFAMLREVFLRRFAKLDPDRRPDLVLVDGGRGQLRQIVDVLSELKVEGIPVVAMAKEKELVSRSGKRSAPERFYLPGQKNALVLPANSSLLHLLQRIRDEAHRFGITRHRKSRHRHTLRSLLERVPRIGPKRQKILLRKIGSLEQIKTTSTEELATIPGISRDAAEAVTQFFSASPDRSEE